MHMQNGEGRMTRARWLLVTFQVFFLSGCAMDSRPPMVPYNSAHEYRLGSGDQIRVVVFDQPTLSAVYAMGASGAVSIPLVGTFKAENMTVRQIENTIKKSLKDKGLVADPKVSVEVAVYRPFSILGEVRNPGRYPYAPGMTIDDAVAAAGGYTIHADQQAIRVTTRADEAQITEQRPPTASFSAGDALYVKERWY
jgi:polysaccharide biosynthesis/export protein